MVMSVQIKLAQKRSRVGRWCWARERVGLLLLQLFPTRPLPSCLRGLKQQKLTDVAVFGKSRLKPRCCPGGSCAFDGTLKLKK